MQNSFRVITMFIKFCYQQSWNCAFVSWGTMELVLWHPITWWEHEHWSQRTFELGKASMTFENTLTLGSWWSLNEKHVWVLRVFRLKLQAKQVIIHIVRSKVLLSFHRRVLWIHVNLIPFRWGWEEKVKWNFFCTGYLALYVMAMLVAARVSILW